MLVSGRVNNHSNSLMFQVSHREIWSFFPSKKRVVSTIDFSCLRWPVHFGIPETFRCIPDTWLLRKNSLLRTGRTSGMENAAYKQPVQRLNEPRLVDRQPSLDGIFQICSSLQQEKPPLLRLIWVEAGSNFISKKTALKNWICRRCMEASQWSHRNGICFILHSLTLPTRNKISSSYSSRYVVELLAPYFGEAFHFDLCILQMVLF